MNREDFEQLTLKQLKAETSKYGLPVVRDKRRMIVRKKCSGKRIFKDDVGTGVVRNHETRSSEGNREPHGTIVSLQ